MDQKELVSCISGKKIVQGNEIYLNLKQSHAFLDVCLLNKVVIVGIEGFIYNEPSLTPDLNLIADFSKNAPSDFSSWLKVSHDSARLFLSEAPPDNRLVFSFVIKS